MKLLRSFPALSFVLVLLSIAGLCAAQKSLGLLLVAGTLAALSWYITEGPRGRNLPRWVSNLLVIAVSLNVFVDLFQHKTDVMGVLGRFAVWLTLIKLYERRTARDHAHLLTLSLLLMMTGCLNSSDMVFGVILLLYAALGLYVLLLYQLYSSFESARNMRQAAIPIDYRLIPPMKPIIGRSAGLHFRTQAAGVAASGLFVSLMVFLFFPRDVGANMLGRIPNPVPARKTQFSNTIDLNDLTKGGRITESRIKVMSVKVTDAQGRAIHRDAPLLLRGAVLDEYANQGRWRTAESPGRMRTILDGELLNDAVHDPDAVIQHVTLNRPESGPTPLFSLYAPLSCTTDPGVSVEYDPDHRTLMSGESTRRLSGYTVLSHPQPQLLDYGPPAERRRLPSLAGRFHDATGKVTRLAETILRNADVPLSRPPTPQDGWEWNRQAAQAFTQYLQDGAFTYTTDLSSVVRSTIEEDPIERFLTMTRRGHCEYFASGLVALCQSVDIPARVVVGYVAYDYDAVEQQYNVLECNAHAWAEVLEGRHAWDTFDPTPPATLLAMHRVQSTLADTVRTVYSSIEGNWSTTIIGFDGTTQNQLAASFNQSWSSRFSTALDSVRDWMENVNTFFNVGPGGYIWMGIVAVALVIAVIALVKLMRRTLAMRRALQLQGVHGREFQRMIRQLGFYLDMLRALKTSGSAKPPWQPPMQFAEALSTHKPAAAELVRHITAMFYEVRYGNKTLDRDRCELAQKLVGQLGAALKR